MCDSTKRRIRLPLALLAALLLLQGYFVEGYAPLSFHPPFQSMRVDGWNIMGSTMVTEQFVRLTSAEAGQEGAIWSVGARPSPRCVSSLNVCAASFCSSLPCTWRDKLRSRLPWCQMEHACDNPTP